MGYPVFRVLCVEPSSAGETSMSLDVRLDNHDAAVRFCDIWCIGIVASMSAVLESIHYGTVSSEAVTLGKIVVP